MIVNREGIWVYVNEQWYKVEGLGAMTVPVAEIEEKAEERVPDIFEEYGIRDLCREVEVFKGWDYEVE